jgi:hypothetical protein
MSIHTERLLVWFCVLVFLAAFWGAVTGLAIWLVS